MMVSRHNDLLKKIEDSPDEAYLHGKELASLSHAMILHEKKQELEAEETSIRDLLEEMDRDGGDDDMARECMEELERIKASQTKLGKKIRIAILPKDENDFGSDAIVEIRAGTGGDEATLFASELQKAYEKTAKSMKWQCDRLTESSTDLGGIKEAVLSISGSASVGGPMRFDMDDDENDNILESVGPYGFFKYERWVVP
jgi:peptide chain release factor 1